MTTTQEIETALHQLPKEQRWEILNRFSDELWKDWDQQIKSDLKNGKLDTLLNEAKADIAAGRTRSLNEILDHS